MTHIEIIPTKAFWIALVSHWLLGHRVHLQMLGLMHQNQGLVE